MTTFRLDTSDGPGTHVFLIGVGNYPHLKDGVGNRVAKPMGMGQLTSPPISTFELLKWMDAELTNSDAPVKSIEVLISGKEPVTFTDAAGVTKQIDEATLNNVEAATQEWFARLDTDERNVGIFYFCGHGLGDGVTTQLLLSDYGSAPIPLKNAIHFNGFRLAMGQCRAQQQIYFIDACRVVDPTMLIDPNNLGSAILPANVTKVFGGANPAFFAAKQGEQAFSKPDQVSYFTRALLDSLGSFGVYRARGKRWSVMPQQLQIAMAALMSDGSGKPECSVDGIAGTGFKIHELASKPRVLLDVFLSKVDANPSAQITCTYSGKSVLRENVNHPWRTVVDFGPCNVTAQFPEGSPYIVDPVTETLFPPLQEIELEVR